MSDRRWPAGRGPGGRRAANLATRLRPGRRQLADLGAGGVRWLAAGGWGRVAAGGAAVTVGVGLALSSPALVVGAPTGLALWRHWVSRVRQRRRDQQLAGEVPPFVDELIQQLKAGRSLAQGLRAACGGYEGSDAGGSALDDALAPLRSGMAAGIGLEAALGRVRSGVPADVELVVNTLSVLVHRGGAALPSLERLSDTLRSAQWVNLEVRAQASQATASAAVLAALPALFVVGLVALDRRMAEFYLTDQAGMACLLAAATLSYVGWWWMDRIIWSRG